jgi:hypothetical protein
MVDELFLQSIGFDKMKLKKFHIRIFDLSKLFNKSNVTISESDLYRREYQTNQGIKSLGSIVINDCLFKLILGTKRINVYSFVNYEYIEINPAAILFGSNIRNVNRADQMENAVDIINKKLEEYGIETDLRQAVIEEIEINTNIRLDGEFSKYRNAFELIRSVLPKTYKTSGSYEDFELGIYTGFKTSNKEISLKLYDKLIEKGIIADYSILRVEYKLLSSDKVEKLFRYSSMEGLLDNFCDKDRVFHGIIEKDIISKVSKRIKELVSLNTKILKQAKNDEKCYIRYYLAISQDDMIFDYGLVCSAINNLQLSKGSKSKRRQELREDLVEREKNGTNSFFGNIDKLNEVFTKMSFGTLDI